MDIPALVVVALLAALAGIVLYLPFYLWAKRKLRPPRRESWITIRITKAGALFYGLMVVILFSGFALGHLAPDTTLGHYMKSGLGQLIFAITLTAVWTLVEALLRRHGFQFYRHVNGTE